MKQIDITHIVLLRLALGPKPVAVAGGRPAGFCFWVSPEAEDQVYQQIWRDDPDWEAPDVIKETIATELWWSGVE
jgi:hypothetical protein